MKFSLRLSYQNYSHFFWIRNSLPNKILDNNSMRSGKYIKQFSGDFQYKSFIPNELPFKINLNDSLQDLLSKANLALGRLDGIVEILPDVDFFILMFLRKEATLSSQIEGTQATFSDLLKAESKLENAEIHNDVDEIQNYLESINYGLERLNTLPLSLHLIKEIHEKLLKGVRGENKTPGEFRRSQNWVGGTSIQNASFIPPPVNEMNQSLHNLEKFIYDKSPLPALIKIGIIHSQFESIHPFLDGNGRIERLLITFYLCQRGILKKPMLYLSEYLKKNRQNYYDKLNDIRENDDIEGWLRFFLEGVKVTSDNAVETVKKINEIRNSDLEKVIKKGISKEKSIILFNYLYRSPYINIKSVEKVTAAKNPTAIGIVNNFIDLEILKEVTRKKRNRVFLYDKYLKLFE